MPKKYNIDEILALGDPIDITSRLEHDLEDAAPGLNVSESTILDALEFDGYISGDGILAWFDSHSSGPIASFRQALTRLGATKNLACIEKALTVFPGSTPPDDYEQYQDAVFGLTQAQRQMVDKCTSDYYGADEDLDELIHQFVLKNIQDFK